MSNVDQGLLDLLNKTLVFNPAFRPTTDALLAHYCLDDIRVPKLESLVTQNESNKIKITCDLKDAPPFLDINEWRYENYQRRPKHLKKYWRAILNEVALFK